MEGSFGTQIKEILRKRDITIKALAEMIEAETGMKMSRQNLTQRLTRDNFQEQDMQMIAKVLGCTMTIIVDEGDYHYDTDIAVEEIKEETAETDDAKITEAIQTESRTETVPSEPEVAEVPEKISEVEPAVAVTKAEATVTTATEPQAEVTVTTATEPQAEVAVTTATEPQAEVAVTVAAEPQAEAAVTIAAATQVKPAAESREIPQTVSPVTVSSPITGSMESSALSSDGRTHQAEEENIYNSKATLEELLARSRSIISGRDEPLPSYTVRSSAEPSLSSSKRLSELTEEARARAAKAREERLQLARKLREEEEKKRSEKEEEERARIKEIARRAVAASRSTKSSFVRDDSRNEETGTINSRSVNVYSDPYRDSYGSYSGYSDSAYDYTDTGRSYDYSETGRSYDYGYQRQPYVLPERTSRREPEEYSERGYQEDYSERSYQTESEDYSGRSYQTESEDYSERNYQTEPKDYSERNYQTEPEVIPEKSYQKEPEVIPEKSYQKESEVIPERNYKRESEVTIERSTKRESEDNKSKTLVSLFRKEPKEEPQSPAPILGKQDSIEEPETLVQAAKRSGEAGAATRNTADMGVVPDVFRRVSRSETTGPDINPRTGEEYDSNVVRNHPKLKGYIQVYDKGEHKWIDMTEWAFLGFQERKKVMLGSDYKPPIYLD